MASNDDVLQRLYNLIERGRIQKSVVVHGTKYTFKSLNDEEYVWRDQFVSLAGPAAIISSIKAPTLAIATVSIDDKPVDTIDKLNTPSGQDNDVVLRDLAQSNKKFVIADNLRQLYSSLPRWYLEQLYEFYVKEIEEPSRKISEEDVINS